MERATLRLRMGTNDAHYAGNLVAGAHLIEYMSDCGTELMIMEAGDEGLLASWKHIEQYIPVYAGDYIEIKAWISRYGNTSRDFEVEVYKVCEPADGGVTGACNIIEPPQLVAKASGVGVIPQEANRGLQVAKEDIPYVPHNGVMWWEKK